MLTIIVAAWLTFQAGAIIGYLICQSSTSRPRRRPTPPLPPVRIGQGTLTKHTITEQAA